MWFVGCRVFMTISRFGVIHCFFYCYYYVYKLSVLFSFSVWGSAHVAFAKEVRGGGNEIGDPEKVLIIS